LASVAERVQALDRACHRLMQSPDDDRLRLMLLEALSAYKAVPVADFPVNGQDLVETSHDLADSLCLRILEANGQPSRSVEKELKRLCRSLAALAATLGVGAGRAAD
jgi:hypothetical protein